MVHIGFFIFFFTYQGYFLINNLKKLIIFWNLTYCHNSFIFWVKIMVLISERYPLKIRDSSSLMHPFLKATRQSIIFYNHIVINFINLLILIPIHWIFNSLKNYFFHLSNCLFYKIFCFVVYHCFKVWDRCHLRDNSYFFFN